ncbi:MAG: RepB family plasmid replication initiator protein [Hymenobacter sp.]|nr:MAG: RepB family plasmid replication initiator protein [Hymenobacter sp.]
MAISKKKKSELATEANMQAVVGAAKAPEAADKIVAQHNALINARFSFVPLQMRLFLALLSRIEFNDVDFGEHFVPFSELVYERHGGSAYEQIDDMCNNITSFKLYIELLEEGTNKRRRRPKYDYIPLMAKAGYDGERGGVVATFNPLIMPYLLQLRENGNFTLAALDELRKLKSPDSARIYWLLREYANFGERTISISQLRFLLDIAENEYPRFSNFKVRILDKAQIELAKTDMPFTYELERQNQIVQQIRFLFGDNLPAQVTEEHVQNVEYSKHAEITENVSGAENAVAQQLWLDTLRQVGVGQRSLQQIARQLENKEYPLSYVDFVLTRIGKQHQLGKVKKPAGAIYKALVEKYLLDEFNQQMLPVARPTQPKLTARHVLLESEVAYSLREVREIFDNPGPFLKKRRQEETFEQHVEQIYLNQGFQQVEKAGEQWLVKPAVYASASATGPKLQ